MTILFGPSFRIALRNRLAAVQESLVILSAYVKTAALEWLERELSGRDIKVIVVTRWQPQDLASGASDVDAYEVALRNGWMFAVSPRLHSKLFLFDDSHLLLGSANMTQKGLHLCVLGNDEAGVEAHPTPIDLARIENYLKDCLWVTGSLYEEFKVAVASLPPPPAPMPTDFRWVPQIDQLLHHIPTFLYVNEFFFSPPSRLIERSTNDADVVHDLELLGIELPLDNEGDLEALVRERVPRTNVWRWLKQLVAASPNQVMRFGEVTARVHDALADDPKPYRKEVKGLVSILFDWAEWMHDEDLTVETYAYTRGIRGL